MKKTAKISLGLVFFIAGLFISIAIMSYLFYKSVNSKVEEHMINRNDPVAVDSVKKQAVADTVHYFNQVIIEKEKIVKDKMKIISDKDTAIKRLRRISDSLSFRLEICRQKNRDLISKNTETSN